MTAVMPPPSGTEPEGSPGPRPAAPGQAPATAAGAVRVIPSYPANGAPRDLPWPAPEEDENPAAITGTAAAVFGLIGLVLALILGVVLGSRGGLSGPGRGGAAATGAPVTHDVTASEFKFAPNQLTMDAPGQLTVNLKDAGVVEHDFSIEGLTGKAAAQPGKTATAVFNFTKPGTYTYFCSLPGHRDAGMQGTIVVGGAGATTTQAQPAVAQPAAPAAPAAQAQPVIGPPVAGAKPLPAPPVAPPVNRNTPANVKVDLQTQEVVAQLADGVTYKFWTFNGTVPGPMIRVRVGDTVDLTLKNSADSSMTHSIDLHAVTGPGGGAKVMQVAPGKTGEFSFKALNPGIYIYHCATPMVAQHIANGMYGMIVVEPEGGLPRVDHEYYVMQGDFYVNGNRGQQGNMDFSMNKMLDERPDYVVFNGGVGNVTGANQLTAKVGDTVRIFFGVGGPNLTSSFHVIGEIFDRVYPEGAIGSPPETNVQTTHVSTGSATAVEFTVQIPGDYTLVDHSLGRLEKGAAGILHVDGDADPAVFNPIQSGS